MASNIDIVRAHYAASARGNIDDRQGNAGARDPRLALQAGKIIAFEQFTDTLLVRQATH